MMKDVFLQKHISKDAEGCILPLCPTSPSFNVLYSVTAEQQMALNINPITSNCSRYEHMNIVVD